MQYESVEIAEDKSREQVVVANFVTQDGEHITIQVIQRILIYKDWTKMAGGIDFDIVSADVSNRLQGHNINEESVHIITKEVRELLEGAGVVFHES